MKRSHDPVFWSLFGAGGMLAALVGPALVFVTGIAVPAGVSPELMSYAQMLALARYSPGKILIFAVIVLFLWHAALRIFHLLHDFGIRERAGAGLFCFGLSLLATTLTGYWLITV